MNIKGELKKEDQLDSYYQSPYMVGSQYGDAYITSKPSSSSSVSASIYAYNVGKYEFTQTEATVDGPTEVPVICNDLIIVSGMIYIL